jgi:hypothetical protein
MTLSLVIPLAAISALRLMPARLAIRHRLSPGWTV